MRIDTLAEAYGLVETTDLPKRAFDAVAKRVDFTIANAMGITCAGILADGERCGNPVAERCHRVNLNGAGYGTDVYLGCIVCNAADRMYSTYTDGQVWERKVDADYRTELEDVAAASTATTASAVWKRYKGTDWDGGSTKRAPKAADWLA